MPPRPPQRTGVVVQLTDELLELYSLDISQPVVRQTSTHQVGCTMGYMPRMHLGLGYSRVTGGCQWAEYIASPSRPSLINKLRHM